MVVLFEGSGVVDERRGGYGLAAEVLEGVLEGVGLMEFGRRLLMLGPTLLFGGADPGHCRKGRYGQRGSVCSWDDGDGEEVEIQQR